MTPTLTEVIMSSRTFEHGHFQRIHNVVLTVFARSGRINGNDYMVYSELSRVVDNETQEAKIRLETLAANVGLSRSTVQLCVKRLTAAGLVETFTSRKQNGHQGTLRYHMLDVGDSQVPPAGISGDIQVPNFGTCTPIQIPNSGTPLKDLSSEEYKDSVSEGEGTTRGTVPGECEANASRTLFGEQEVPFYDEPEEEITRVQLSTKAWEEKTLKEAFEDFWKRWPVSRRKGGKDATWQRFRKAVDVYRLDEFFKAIDNYLEATEVQFVKWPKNFLNPKDFWEDWINHVPVDEDPARLTGGHDAARPRTRVERDEQLIKRTKERYLQAAGDRSDDSESTRRRQLGPAGGGDGRDDGGFVGGGSQGVSDEYARALISLGLPVPRG
jgi:predicted transcriptional regulator